MESDEKTCRHKRHKSPSSSNSSSSSSIISNNNNNDDKSNGHKDLTSAKFLQFLFSCRPKLDDVKIRGKIMAKTAALSHHLASTNIRASRQGLKGRPLKAKSNLSDEKTALTTGNHPRSRRLATSPATKKQTKKVEYKNQNIKELTHELVTKAQKKFQSKGQLNNADHPVRKSEPKIESIFQEGRQRPNGPVRTFIVFKASSKHNQLKRKKAKRGLRSTLPSEKRFNASPAHNPRFYKKSELVGLHRPSSKGHLNDKIHVQSARADRTPDMAPVTKIHTGADARQPTATQRRGTKTAFPVTKDASKGASKGTSKLTLSSTVPVAIKRDKSSLGVAFAKKTHVGSSHQTKEISKRKSLSVSILQKKPVRRQSSRVRKPARGKLLKRRIKHRATKVKKPAALALSRKGRPILAYFQPGVDPTLKKRIVHVQNLKKFERDQV